MQTSRQRVLLRAPDELTSGKLRRIGEGIGKVVYASQHWVVKRERSNREMVALIMVWRLVRRFRRLLPIRVLRLLKFFLEAVITIIPTGLWLESHIADIWRAYRKADNRGSRLADTHLAGTDLVPERICFPPTKVHVGGWLGFLVVNEADERVETTLHQRLHDLARAGDYDRIEQWLDRFLDLRQCGWERGVFSTDAHLKNYGVTGDRVVLLDPGGLTNSWTDIEKRLTFEDVVGEPHIQLGLGPALGARPDIAARFNARWKQIVNKAGVRARWPTRVFAGSPPSVPSSAVRGRYPDADDKAS